MTNSGCGWTFHDHVAVPPDPLLSRLTSTREASHDALEMIKDLKKNPLALRGLTSAVELEGSLVPPACLELKLCLTDTSCHISLWAHARRRTSPPTYHVMQMSQELQEFGCATIVQIAEGKSVLAEKKSN